MGPSSWHAPHAGMFLRSSRSRPHGRRGPLGPRREPGRAPAWYKEEVMAIFSARVERAVAVALRAHRERIVHPVTGALILPRHSDDQDRIIAGLLHGTLH